MRLAPEPSPFTPHLRPTCAPPTSQSKSIETQIAPHNKCSFRSLRPTTYVLLDPAPHPTPHLCAPSPSGTLSSFSITRFSASPIVTSISNVHFANYPYFRSPTTPYASPTSSPAHHQVSQQFAFPSPIVTSISNVHFANYPYSKSSTTPYASPTSSPAHHQVSQQFAFPKSCRHLYIQCSFCNCPYSRSPTRPCATLRPTSRPHPSATLHSTPVPGATSSFLVIHFPSSHIVTSISKEVFHYRSSYLAPKGKDRKNGFESLS